MSKNPLFHAAASGIKSTCKVLIYPGGIRDYIASSSPDFGPGGWEAAEDWSHAKQAPPAAGRKERDTAGAQAEDVERSLRRARAKVRRLALANNFRWFVTLTLDPGKVDSHDGAAVVRKLNAWLSNQVQRAGLKYLLVPERHKKGGIHFHGFFSDSVKAVDSGTIVPPGGSKPRRPRSEAQRAEWLRNGGRVVYNLPGWTLGFTTAQALYGEYPAAVAYVCKYIGKEGEKPAGRWYYSGGDLREPEVAYAEISPAELAAAFPEHTFVFSPPGRKIAVVNGVKEDFDVGTLD